MIKEDILHIEQELKNIKEKFNKLFSEEEKEYAKTTTHTPEGEERHESLEYINKCINNYFKMLFGGIDYIFYTLNKHCE